MIKFFRSIRKALLDENKFSKYLLYAIGEIVLVVIGILIALQINNWNESRKIEREIESVISLLDDELTQNIFTATGLMWRGDRVDSLVSMYNQGLFTEEFLKDKPNILLTLFQTEKGNFRHENLDNLISLEKQFPDKHKNLIPHLKYLRNSLDLQGFWEKKSVDLFYERFKEVVDTEEWVYSEVDKSEELYNFFNDPLFNNKVNHYIEIQHDNLANISRIRNASIGLLWISMKSKTAEYPDIRKFYDRLRLKPIQENDCDEPQVANKIPGYRRTFLIYNDTDETISIDILNSQNGISKPFLFPEIPPKMHYFGDYTLRNGEQIKVSKNGECHNIYYQTTTDFIMVE